MTIVSTREFRANQSKYFGMVDRGEHVILKSRHGRYRLTPVSKEDEEEPKRDITEEICQGLEDWKNFLDGKDTTTFRPANELINELRNL
ncbi:MAG: prevent-host-death family protein [Prevotella sp.]|nr:prevent-host-death family protein [Prevotella sp.]